MTPILSLVYCIFIIMQLVVAFNKSNDIDDSSQTKPFKLDSQDALSQAASDKLMTTAIKAIAYYLRDHKFNEWDRRYYQDKPDENMGGIYGSFPTPPLRSLHWEVKKNCHDNFYTCIHYLHRITETATYSRDEDTAVVLNENTTLLNETMIKRLNIECKERHMFAEKVGLPFDEPIEKFQWRSTASYYMCWFTMLGTPALSMIGECCDNFANCLGKKYLSHNNDPRADDKFSFACAMYSFCPDPCCPIRHALSMDDCRNDKRNPCFPENIEGNSFQRRCQFNRKLNQNFKNIVKNKWNIACNCRNGFEWASKFGICVDINECLLRNHDCNPVSQDCLNLPGTFHCLCKWGFDLDKANKICVKRNYSYFNQ